MVLMPIVAEVTQEVEVAVLVEQALHLMEEQVVVVLEAVLDQVEQFT